MKFAHVSRTLALGLGAMFTLSASAALAADAPAASKDAPAKPSELAQALDSWSNANVPAAPGSVSYALTHGTPWVVARYRFEEVQQDLSKHANASTLRTRLGYETGAYQHFKLGAEFENISEIGRTNYNNGYNGKSSYAQIKDAEDTTLNQLYLSYEPIAKTKATVGRQVISFDNQRWVGESDWRQNNQTFDAISVSSKTIANADLTYAFVGEVNRTSGPKAPDGGYDSHSHLVNLSYQFAPELKATAYGYLLDFSDATTSDTKTFGLRLKGEHPVSDKVKLAYTAEGAKQQDYGRNLQAVNENYYLLEPAVSAFGLTGKLGYEELQGNGVTAVQTPLASFHSFNGWANKFSTTPANGLEDRYASLTYKVPFGSQWIKGTSATVAYHTFDAYHIDSTYGREWDFNLIQTFADHYTVGIEFDNYQADSMFTDTKKVDVWVGVKF